MLHEQTDEPGPVKLQMCSQPPFIMAQLLIIEQIFPMEAYPVLQEQDEFPGPR